MGKPFAINTAERQLADEFRRRIAGGSWGDKIPGILRLCRELGVSRPLVEKTVAMLLETGEIRHHGVGKAMRPVRAAIDEKFRPGTLIVHELAPAMHGGETMQLLRAIESAMPRPVTMVHLDKRLSDDEIVARILETGAPIIFLSGQRTAVSDRLLAEGRKVINLGSSALESHTPRIGADYEYVVRESLRRAFAAGHTNVSMPLWNRPQELVTRLRAWVADEYAKAGLHHSPNLHAPHVEDADAKAMHTCVRELFKTCAPTALILHDLPQWLAVSSTLAKLRIVVPEQVSIILLSRWPELENLTEPPSHFHNDVAAFIPAVKKIVKHLEQGVITPPIRIKSQWAPGATLVPPSRPN